MGGTRPYAFTKKSIRRSAHVSWHGWGVGRPGQVSKAGRRLARGRARAREQIMGGTRPCRVTEQ